MRVFFVLSSFLTLPVLACPQLAGIYKTCSSSTGQGSSTSEVLIEQKLINKIHHFTITTKEADDPKASVERYKADGKTKIITDIDPDTGITIKTETTASCSGNVLNLKMNATVDSEEFANILIKVSKSNHQLTQDYSGTSMGDPINDHIVCE